MKLQVQFSVENQLFGATMWLETVQLIVERMSQIFKEIFPELWELYNKMPKIEPHPWKFSAWLSSTVALP